MYTSILFATQYEINTATLANHIKDFLKNCKNSIYMSVIYKNSTDFSKQIYRKRKTEKFICFLFRYFSIHLRK